MSVSETKLGKALTIQMSHGMHKGKLLAHNIAHADNPGYKRQDLKDISFSHFLKSPPIAKPSLKVTSGHHLLPSGSSQSAFEQLAKENNLFSVSDTGVSPEEEMIQISGNASKIQFLMNIYKKQRNLFKIALGKNEG